MFENHYLKYDYGKEKIVRAAILENGKLEIRDVPKPSPKNEEVLIRLTAAGVCHSDVHHVRSDWPAAVKRFAAPMGHEGIGIVEELGPGAKNFVKIGDRVILGLGGSGACGPSGALGGVATCDAPREPCG